MFLAQSLPEVFLIFSMYVVHLELGHTLLCKNIKSGTISRYISQAATRIMERRQRHALAFPTSILTWFRPCRKHGSTTMAPKIISCLAKINRWENMKDWRKPLTTDMIYYQKSQCSAATPHSVAHAMYDWRH
jgi:hypothetical protein